MNRFLLPGDKIAGKYRILRRLGQGGMGVVYLSLHERLGRQVAIKVLHTQLEHMKEAMARFELEIRAMAKVNNRHVAQAFDADVLEDGSPFLVMEYLDGRDLRAEMKLRRAIPYQEAVSYIIQTCEGVAAVHDVGIVHRDLKPNNLFVTNLDAVRCVKILDFGIVKLLSDADASMTAENTAVGTPLYMSPEQLNNDQEISPSSDVWAMGVVLYELIAGVSPFAADRPGAVVAAIMLEEPPPLSRLVPGLPTQVSEAISGALAKSPAKRIGSARELAARLEPYSMPMTDLIVVPTTPSGRPVVLPKRETLRPELSARIQNEIERGGALVPGNVSIRVDELRQLPSLARLSIPLTSAAVPLARRAALRTSETESCALNSSEKQPSFVPTRFALPSNINSTRSSVTDVVEKGAKRWRTKAVVGTAMLLGIGMIAFWVSRPKTVDVPTNEPMTLRLPVQQNVPFTASKSTHRVEPEIQPKTIDEKSATLLKTSSSANTQQRLELAPTIQSATLQTKFKLGTQTVQKTPAGVSSISKGERTPGVVEKRLNPTDKNPTHL